MRLTLLSLFVSFTVFACGDDDPCPAGQIRVGAVCIASMPDAGVPDTGQEVCNGVDDDMDGNIDEADPMLGAECGEAVGACTLGVFACTEGELLCDGVQPTDETCNAIDDDCDGTVDEEVMGAFFIDVDGDGVGSGDACSACDAESCGAGTWVTQAGDCDEECDTCYEGALETCDELDNDCDALIDEEVQTLLYTDDDGDGFGIGLGSAGCLDAEGVAPEGFSVRDGDCADEDPRANPENEMSFSTPIEGMHSGLAFDFDCDGEEVQLHDACASDSIPTCRNGACLFSFSELVCGGFSLRRTSIRGFDGMCSWVGEEFLEWDVACR